MNLGRRVNIRQLTQIERADRQIEGFHLRVWTRAIDLVYGFS